VRKLGEANGAFGLETIPRVGYRLVLNKNADMPLAAAAGAASPSRFNLAGLMQRRGMALALAGGLIVLAVTGFLVFGRAAKPPDIDAVVAQLTQKLRAQKSDPGEIARIGATAKALGGSERPEERSAFAYLASGDSPRAVDLLEALAKGYEAKGETIAAAEVYTKIGAIALVFDQGRGLAARRKAIQLQPDSLPAFQGLFLDLVLLRGAPEALALAEETLARAGLSDRMRAWVLAHRGLVETDFLIDDVRSRATLQQLEDIQRRRPGDIVVEYAASWLASLIALNEDDLARGAEIARMGIALGELPERLPNNNEVALVRILSSVGDWSRAFSQAAADLEQRGRTGGFLPTPTIEVACVAGVYSGQAQAAEPYCRSLTQRLENSGGVMPRAFAGLIAAGLGDAKTASSEFAAAEALLPAGSRRAPDVWVFEGYGALQRGDIDTAERMIMAAVHVVDGPPPWRNRRSFTANALRLLGEGFIRNGKPARACAPLAEAGRFYRDVGAEVGRAAVDVLRSGAGCPA
jgi:tetratricopeptide (TPR) repeat protein